MTRPAHRLAWVEEGARLFLDQLAAVPDSAFSEPGTLPGWTTGHLVAHVGYNAKALSRLVHWARTGEETPMYESPEARDAEIEQGAKLSADRLRALVRETDERLRADLAELTRWDAGVRTAQGRLVPATEIPWLRVREVWIHLVDLGTGVTFEDFPAELLDALITDIATLRERRDQGPALVLEASDREDGWHIEVAGAEPALVRGSAAELCRWLAGRGGLDGPDLARWL
ncbi:maleylpyruvate isomerase family mycothiol-dependent enzyme [Amycolatopsis acidiphila]|uniref:Maleylpyruvate isomerase family mycothiol-dependent enzyme n=1 Tax=Amycolatopsis acidiphila TaxID=715473 RepID=A0A558AK22_9PSEU|nr:maleylpyruvate isomerase family mycothiol-dependent enzyme [Amycolatopsis acidiphila]TVT24599.1 maleylpyruvate isomerase family mycothiol-dependent enzyme [Amycolatopsis acidiphila]UIJ58547.1 maleylpyruvate isomerase family mycothiol-dependent enzyme [Amycolatopsis acidiphila]GHG76917.1 maleylpyruvate isomerase [Amycolatopsis acidiphila]